MYWLKLFSQFYFEERVLGLISTVKIKHIKINEHGSVAEKYSALTKKIMTFLIKSGGRAKTLNKFKKLCALN